MLLNALVCLMQPLSTSKCSIILFTVSQVTRMASIEGKFSSVCINSQTILTTRSLQYLEVTVLHGASALLRNSRSSEDCASFHPVKVKLSNVSKNLTENFVYLSLMWCLICWSLSRSPHEHTGSVFPYINQAHYQYVLAFFHLIASFFK